MPSAEYTISHFAPSSPTHKGDFGAAIYTIIRLLTHLAARLLL